jgi:hypothetical protein
VASPHQELPDRRAGETVEVSGRAGGRGQQVIFVLRLTPLPGVDAVKALRAALKVLLRRFGLRALSIRDDEARS